MLALSFLALSMLHMPAAQAADGRDLSEDLIKTAEVTRTGEGAPDQPLRSYEDVKFTFTWDSSSVEGTSRSPEAGDYITVDAPQWLRFTGAKVDMKSPDGDVVATCAENRTSPTSVTCTFTDYVEANPVDLKGEYSTVMSTGAAREVTDKAFKVGPVDLNITDIVDQDVSGEIVLSDGQFCHPLTDKVSKDGGWNGPTDTSDGKSELWWEIKIPGNGRDITVTDTLAKPQKKKAAVVYERDASTEDEEHCNWFVRDSYPGGASTPINERVDISWSTTDSGEEKATITIPNSEVGKHYRVVFWTLVPADAFKYGSTLQNEAFVDDQAVTGTAWATKVTNASASGNPDLGGVWVYKALSGDAKSLVPADDTYTVKASWTQDGAEHTEELTVTPGETPAKLENLPKGTEVTLSELKPADTSSYTWGSPVFADGQYGTASSDQVVVSDDKQSAVVTIKGGENWPIQVTNTATKPKANTATKLRVGKFSVTKEVEDSDGVAADKTFTFAYTCTLEGQADVTGTLRVKAGETAESEEVPEGYECVVTEDTDAAAVDGATLATEAGEPITIVAGKTVNTTVKNTYTRDVSTFTITKKLQGTDAAKALVPADASFAFDYTYPAGPGFDAGSGTVTVKADGAAVTSEPVPVGAVVTFTEKTPEAVEGLAWGSPTFSPDTFTVENDQVVNVTVTNPVTETLGGFSVVKNVSGEGAKRVPEGTTFSVAYSWETPSGEKGEGAVDVVAGGDPVVVNGIPGGATVTLTENGAPSIEGVQWLDPQFSDNGFTVIAGKTVAVDLDNPTQLTPGAPDEPTSRTPSEPTQHSRSWLARTGADTAVAAALGALLVGAGAAVHVAARRRSLR